jgi:hypothetical protein
MSFLQVERLLAPNGLYMVISYGIPDDRLKYLEIYDIDDPLFTPWYTDVLAVRKLISYIPICAIAPYLDITNKYCNTF